MHQQHGRFRSWALPSGSRHFLPDQSIDQRTFSGSGASERRHNKRRFQAKPQRLNAAQQAAHEGSAAMSSLPVGAIVDPALQAVGEVIDLSQQCDMFQLVIRRHVVNFRSWQGRIKADSEATVRCELRFPSFSPEDDST